MSPDTISTDLTANVKRQTTKFMTSLKRSVEEAWTLGQLLHEAKGQCSHGQWLPWLRKTIRLNPRVAQRCMKVYDRYPDKELALQVGSIANALGKPTSRRKSSKKAEAGASKTDSDSSEDERPRSFRKELDGVAGKMKFALEDDPARVVQHFGEYFPELSGALVMMASILQQCLEHGSGEEAVLGTLPKNFASVLRNLLAEVPESDSQAGNSE